MTLPTKVKLGRPSTATVEKLNQILERMREGESSRSICRDPNMLTWSALHRFLASKEGEAFRDQYAQARECMIDALMIDSLDISRDKSRDYQEVVETIESEKGTITKTKTVSDNTAAQRDRLIVDTIHKVAARVLPQKYSEKILQEITGKDGERFQITVNVRPKVVEQID